MALTEDNRKKLRILAIVGGVCILLLVAIELTGGRKDGAAGDGGSHVYAEIPDASTDELGDSKIEDMSVGTRGDSNMSRWWDELGEEVDTASPDESGGGKVPTEDFIGEGREEARPSGERAQEALGLPGTTMTADELRALLEEGGREDGSTPQRQPSGGGYGGGPRQGYRDGYQPAPQQPAQQGYQAPVQAGQGQTAAQPEPAREQERITVATSDIRRSSPVTSFDDDWSTAGGGSGVSSFDSGGENISTDGRHPFRCMFMKDEKLVNGQRVTLRLLEDIVVDGVVISANSHLTAICEVSDRLQLNVTSYERNGAIYSLDYEAFDNDGLKGIYCPSLSGAKDQAVQQGEQMANTYAGSRMGRVAQDIMNTVIQVSRSAKGEVTVSVPQGYTFYIVRKRAR